MLPSNGNKAQATITVYANLLWSEIITNDVLETLANPFLGDGIEVTLGEDRVNDARVLIALFGGDYCATLDEEKKLPGVSRQLKPGQRRGNIRDILRAFNPCQSSPKM